MRRSAAPLKCALAIAREFGGRRVRFKSLSILLLAGTSLTPARAQERRRLPRRRAPPAARPRPPRARPAADGRRR